MQVTELLDKLERVKISRGGWIARCPAHEDKNPSLSINADNGRILVHCHAGCAPAAICEALGISQRDLFANNANGSEATTQAAAKNPTEPFEGTDQDVERFRCAFVESAEVQAYVQGRGIFLRVATDLGWGFAPAWTFGGTRKPALVIPHGADGKLVGVKARTISGTKEFSQMKGSRMDGLYAAHRLDPNTEEVLVVEGPEDCALLISHAFNVTAINSASAKPSADDIKRLSGYKRVFLVGDQDLAGQRAMQELGQRIPAELAIRVRIPGFKDVGEMYHANSEKFAANLHRILRWARASRDFFDLDDLLTETEIRAGLEGIQPYVVDKLVPKNSIIMLFGEEKSGKSLLVTYILKCVANGRAVFGKYAVEKVPVLYLDLENSGADIESYSGQFARLGPEPVRYRTRATGCPDLASPGLIRFCERYKPLLAIDSLTKFLRGTDPFHPGEMSELFDKLLDLCAAGATIIVVHHATRADAERYADSHQIGAAVSRAFAVVSEDRPRLGYVRLEPKLFRGAEPVTERLVAFPVIAERGEFGLADAYDPAQDPDVERVVTFVKSKGPVNRTTIRANIGIKTDRASKAVDRALKAGLIVADSKQQFSVPE